MTNDEQMEGVARVLAPALVQAALAAWFETGGIRTGLAAHAAREALRVLEEYGADLRGLVSVPSTVQPQQPPQHRAVPHAGTERALCSYPGAGSQLVHQVERVTCMTCLRIMARRGGAQ